MEDNPIITQIESLKLMKMSKGYNWEIRLVGKAEENIERIKKLNEEFSNEYGEGIK